MSAEMVISLACAVISAIVGPVCLLLINRRLKAGDEEKRQAEKRDGERIKAIVSDVMTDGIKPLKDDLSNLNDNLEKLSDGTLSTLRNDILTCYYKCTEKGFRNEYDSENVHHMFDAYRELNGNSYVADIVCRFDRIDTKEEYEAKQKRKKAKRSKKKSAAKSILVENIND